MFASQSYSELMAPTLGLGPYSLLPSPPSSNHQYTVASVPSLLIMLHIQPKLRHPPSLTALDPPFHTFLPKSTTDGNVNIFVGIPAVFVPTQQLPYSVQHPKMIQKILWIIVLKELVANIGDIEQSDPILKICRLL